MKVTRILNFTEEEVETLVAAGKLLSAVEKEYNAETADDVQLGEDAASLINALKEVLYKLGRDDGE